MEARIDPEKSIMESKNELDLPSIKRCNPSSNNAIDKQKPYKIRYLYFLKLKAWNNKINNVKYSKRWAAFLTKIDNVRLSKWIPTFKRKLFKKFTKTLLSWEDSIPGFEEL